MSEDTPNQKPSANPPPEDSWLGRLTQGAGWLVSRAQERMGQASSLEQDARELGEDLLALAESLTYSPQQLQILPIRNQFYGHGAFMGAAPALFADRQWRKILAFLMPDVYQHVSERVQQGAHGAELMPMFENNPVMCAFGLWSGMRLRDDLAHEPGAHDLTGIEWDVFIDGGQIKRWLKSPAQTRSEIMREMVDTMVIAHASGLDTVHEQMGLDQYGDVRRTPKAALGGVEANAWMDLFARALALIEADDLNQAITDMSPDSRIEAGDACVKQTFATPWPYAEACSRFINLTGQSCFSIVLEIKSLASTPELLTDMMRELNRRGVRVAAVASFRLPEIAGLGQISQQVDGSDYPPPRELLFFHYAGNLQLACDKGLVPKGQSVLFNGGSLLERQPETEIPYRLMQDVLKDLALYKQRYDLHIGLYVQENDCDAAAAGLLSELVDSHSEIFDLGFAWGGLLNTATAEFAEARRGDLRGHGSQRLLERIGQAIYWQVGELTDTVVETVTDAVSDPGSDTSSDTSSEIRPEPEKPD